MTDMRRLVLATLLCALPLSASAKIKVLIWEPHYLRLRWGHIAVLEDKDYKTYVSFRPAQGTSLFGQVFGSSGTWRASLTEDVAQDGEPSRVIEMSTLDSYSLKSYMRGVSTKPQRWGLVRGDTSVSFASRALERAGLQLGGGCSGTVAACVARLERAYAEYLKTPRPEPPIAQRAAHRDEPAAPPQPPPTFDPQVQRLEEPLRPVVTRHAVAAAPDRAESIAHHSCRTGSHWDPTDQTCYENDTTNRGSGSSSAGVGSSVSGYPPQPATWEPGVGIKSR